jgi:glycosyltransferase involved in cell wall biosynthesis
MSDQDLLGLYRRAKVYVQVSAHEGFGLAVAESMATECVPVVTRRGSLPEVVGDTGRYVDFQDATATAEAVRQVLTLPDAAGATARQRVIERFTIQRRAARLIKLVDDMIAGHAD